MSKMKTKKQECLIWKACAKYISLGQLQAGIDIDGLKKDLAKVKHCPCEGCKPYMELAAKLLKGKWK